MLPYTRNVTNHVTLNGTKYESLLGLGKSSKGVLTGPNVRSGTSKHHARNVTNHVVVYRCKRVSDVVTAVFIARSPGRLGEDLGVRLPGVRPFHQFRLGQAHLGWTSRLECPLWFRPITFVSVELSTLLQLVKLVRYGPPSFHFTNRKALDLLNIHVGILKLASI
ncbi:hypothetical protein J6590_011572 [Homalodisca vitripennis]|nr:hypothetical protein J6590_011572 [Homalodisca vitripennis]